MSSFNLVDITHQHLQLLCWWSDKPYNKVIRDAMDHNHGLTVEGPTTTIPISLHKSTSVLVKTKAIELDTTMSNVINLFVEGYYQDKQDEVLARLRVVADDLKRLRGTLDSPTLNIPHNTRSNLMLQHKILEDKLDSYYTIIGER